MYLNNISRVSSCYGCGVCSIVCNQKIIEIKLNNDGFYEPLILNQDRCTHCGSCLDVCSFVHNELSESREYLNSYAAWSLDSSIRSKCTSGGVAFELEKLLLMQGYKVCGVRYNIKKNCAEHYVASNISELFDCIGSKYIQSFTVPGFSSIDRKSKYLITGTPCQIDSIRRYVKKNRCEDNFILLDFFCHGVPSILLWNKYLYWKKEKSFSSISWRNKNFGWHNSYHISFEGGLLKKVRSAFFSGDMFYSLFLGDYCLGKQCYKHCKYKLLKSSADIRVGDLWGDSYSENEEGVSAVISFTRKGDELLKKTNCKLIALSCAVVTDGQMEKAPEIPSQYGKIMELLRDRNTPITDIYRLIYPHLFLHYTKLVLKYLYLRIKKTM